MASNDTAQCAIGTSGQSHRDTRRMDGFHRDTHPPVRGVSGWTDGWRPSGQEGRCPDGSVATSSTTLIDPVKPQLLRRRSDARAGAGGRNVNPPTSAVMDRPPDTRSSSVRRCRLHARTSCARCRRLLLRRRSAARQSRDAGHAGDAMRRRMFPAGSSPPTPPRCAAAGCVHAPGPAQRTRSAAAPWCRHLPTTPTAAQRPTPDSQPSHRPPPRLANWPASPSRCLVYRASAPAATSAWAVALIAMVPCP
jgi:hypothetical protein